MVLSSSKGRCERELETKTARVMPAPFLVPENGGYELDPVQTGLPLVSLMFCFQLVSMIETTSGGKAT